MTLSFLDADQVRTYPPASWQRILYDEFEATLTSKSRSFPCVYGIAGLKGGHLRFAFVDPLTPETLAPILAAYVASARSFGPMTSLVVFARPGPVQKGSEYRSRFWSLLDGLVRLDEAPWPADIPETLDSDRWEFCFAGEPIFVVCNSPAHVLRQSRRSTSFMLTFQPRWVFEGLMDDTNPAARRARETVRDRLSRFDAVPPATVLGTYGESENREYQQYFIDDSNDVPACPYHKLGMTKSTHNKGRVA